MKAFISVVLVDRWDDERGTRARGVMRKAEYTKGCGERARGEGAAPPARGAAKPLARDTIRGVGADTGADLYFTVCGARRGDEPSSTEQKHTHGIEQRCIVRVECGPSYRFAYLLLPLQHVRHRDVFGKVHLAVEDDALAQDRGDVHCILMLLMARYCHRINIYIKYMLLFFLY